MIRRCRASDSKLVLQIINDAAMAYKGIIPADMWSEPYMTHDYLLRETEKGVRFWGCEHNGRLVAVMGIQQVQDVTLIRHAYVRTVDQGRGLGGRLLKFLCRRLPEIATTARKDVAITDGAGRVLVGTWADAVWAIGFYEKHNFILVSKEEKSRLLKKYWSIPDRQVETSVVLELHQAAIPTSDG